MNEYLGLKSNGYQNMEQEYEKLTIKHPHFTEFRIFIIKA